MKSNKLALASFSAGALYLGAKMQTNQFKYYGLLAGNTQISAYIKMVCYVISPTTQEQASKLLAETIAIESDNGNARDYSPIYGEGLTQFDKPTFEDVKRTFSAQKYAELRAKIQLYLFTDILSAEYEDLRKSPMLSIIYARLLYYRVNANIPLDFNGRWLYYKKWFNSYAGASTKEKYISASKRSVNV